MIEAYALQSNGVGYRGMTTRLGQLIEEALAAREMSRTVLAAQTGISLSGISRIINGPSEPDLRTLDALARVLSLPLEWFIEAAGYLLSQTHTPTEMEIRNLLLTPATLATLERMGTAERAKRIAFLDRALRDRDFFNRILGYAEGLEDNQR